MGNDIRIRVCLAVVEGGRILLLPHYNTDAGPIQWVIPGGRLEFGERLEGAALREFEEETGLQAAITGLLDVSQVIHPERPYHSITVIFSGRTVGGKIGSERDHPYGTRVPRWFSSVELADVPYHPPQTVRKALDMPVETETT